MRVRERKWWKSICTAFVAAGMLAGSAFTSSMTIKAESSDKNFFYNIQNKTGGNLNNGDIIYISTDTSLQDPDFVSVEFPTVLSASLEIVGTVDNPTDGADWNAPNHITNKEAAIADATGQGYDVANGYSVSVAGSTDGFDGCNHGWLFYKSDGTWHYYCWNSGVFDGGKKDSTSGVVTERKNYSGYSVNSGSITSNDITVEATEPTSDRQIYDNTNVKVKVNCNGQTFTLPEASYTVLNGDVNKANVDASISVKLNDTIGTTKEIVFNTYAQDAAKEKLDTKYVQNNTFMKEYYPAQQNEIKAIVDKLNNNVAAAKSQAEIDKLIADAETAINSVNKMGPADDKTASDFNTGYKNLLTKQYVTRDDLADIIKAENEYKAMTPDAKAKVADQYKTIIAEKAAAEWDDAHKAMISKTTPATAKDLQTVEAALNDYKNLSEDQKSHIDPSVIKDLENKQATAQWSSQNAGVITAQTVGKDDVKAIEKALTEAGKLDAKYAETKTINDLKVKLAAAKWDEENSAVIYKSSVNDNDLTAIEKALASYDKLSEAEKANVDATVITDLKAKKNAAEWDKANRAILDKTSVNENDVEAINNALDAYNKLSDAEKASVDASTIANLKAKKNAADWAEINKNSVNTDRVSANNLPSLDKALADYNKLSDAEKACVDQSVINDLRNKQQAAAFLKNNEAILKKNPIGLADKAAFDKALAQYNALSDEQKACLDIEAVKALQAQKDAMDFLTTYGNILNKKLLGAGDLSKINAALAAYNKLDDATKKMLGTEVLETLNKNKAEVNKILTGDTTNTGMFAFVSIISLGGLFVMLRKRRMCK